MADQDLSMDGVSDFLPLTAKYDAQTSIVSDILGGAVATVADFGASVWNSLPLTENVDTADLLSRVDSNALRIYEEHPDAIHAASFIGGVFVPVGLALKGMSAARNGMKGVNFFSEAGRVAQMKRVDDTLRASGIASASYKAELRSLYTRNFVNNALIDNAAAEVAILGTMNAHPFMEDYVKDPVKNFGISMLFGAGIVGPISHIGLRSQLRREAAGVYAENIAKIREGEKEIPYTESATAQMAAHEENIRNWSAMLDGSNPVFGKVEPSSIPGGLLTAFINKSKVDQLEIFKKAASPELKEMAENPTTLPYIQKLISDVSNNPAFFEQMNIISHATAREEVDIAKAAAKGVGKLHASTNLGEGIPLTREVKSGATAGDLVPDAMVYSPRFQAFMKKSDLDNFGAAADTGRQYKTLTEGMTSNWFMTANQDADIEMLLKSSAYMDLEYLRKMKALDEVADTDLSKVVISPEDGPMLNAMLARFNRLSTSNPTLAADLKITLTKELPNFGKLEQEMARTYIPAKSASGGAGVKPTHVQDLQDLTSPANLRKFSLTAPGNSAPGLASMFREWISDFKKQKPIREKFSDAFLLGTEYFAKEKGYKTSQAEIDMIRKGYDSPGSVAFRAALMQHADSDGFIYLLRGLKTNKIYTTNILESFTTHISKGGEFSGANGSVKYYKVHVNDVYGAMRDDAVGVAGADKSVEILVLAHNRQAFTNAADIPVVGAQALKDAVPTDWLKLEKFYTGAAKDLKSIDKQNIKNLTINLFDDFAQVTPKTSFAGTEAEWLAQAEVFVKAGIDEYIQDIISFNAAKASAGITATTNQVDFMGLLQADEAFREKTLTAMLKQGIPAETAALKTGSDLEYVKAFMAGGDTSTLNPRAYRSAADIESQFAIENRSLVVNTTRTKIPTAEIRASLLNQQATVVDQQITDFIFEQSPSAVLREFKAFFSTTDNRALKDMLEKGLALITPSSIGNKFFQSSDFALRDLGDLGKIINNIGKDAVHLKKNFTEKILRPVSDSFAAITKDAAAVVEFNTAKEVNASLKGKRLFEVDQDGIGRFTQLNETTQQWEPVLYKGSVFEVKTPSVVQAYENIQAAGRELYAINSTMRKVLGQDFMSDLGFWMPAFNPKNKFRTFVYDQHMLTTKQLWGHTKEELEAAEAAYTKVKAPGEIFIRAGQDQEMWNKLAGRTDPIFMQSADVGAFHSGASALAIPRTDTGTFSELANAYEHYVHKSVDTAMEIQFSNVLDHLDRLSIHAQSGIAKQSVSDVQKMLSKPTDAGLVVKNTLLGRSDLKESVGWGKLQNSIQTHVEFALQHITQTLDPVLNPVKGIFGKGKSFSDERWEALNRELTLRGIPNPFEGMDEYLAKQLYHVERISQAPNLTPRVVALGNSLAATFLLKVLELGQPLVNMLSLPILTSAAIQQRFSAEFAGATLSPTFRTEVVKSMYEGVRYLGHPEYAKYRKMGNELGIFTPVVSEVSEMMQLTRSFNPGAMQRVENALQSKLVELLSVGSNWSEKASREVAFAVGVRLAKKAYPGIGDHGVMTFARNFVDTAIGNYTPVQRPTVFQGTMGVAMGLFQTYFVTLAQQIYRGIELRDFKALAKMMLMQGSVFGAKSLPGFNPVSELIGEHFSDQNYDLTTGTYRALPEPMADILLYGLPSNLGPAVYSRGDIQPRLPNIAGGLQNLAAVNIVKSAWAAGDRMLLAAKEIGDAGAGMALMEALSVQSISRPVARVSELFTGHSVTSNGKEIAGPEEIYTVPGITARVFAMRSLTESKAREAYHLNRMYGAVDKENRQTAIVTLKNHIRSGTLSPEIVERVQEKYMRTGSPQGWRSAINTAMAETDRPGVSAVRSYLSPRSPANLMVDDLD